MSTNFKKQVAEVVSRRDMLRYVGGGFAVLGLNGVLAQQSQAAAVTPHFAPRAKRVISLFMSGGPSQVDTFDPKPLLAKLAGQKPKAPTSEQLRRPLACCLRPYVFVGLANRAFPFRSTCISLASMSITWRSFVRCTPTFRITRPRCA